MSKGTSTIEIGQIVRVTKGREKGKLAVIIGKLSERFVLLADGDKRKYDSPKKKNVQHIEPTDFISEEVRMSLLETKRVSNGKLRFAIAKYEEKLETLEEKGDVHDV